MEHTFPAHVVAISLNDRETPSLDKIVPAPVPLFIGTENVNSSREGTRPSIVISDGFEEISTGSAMDYHATQLPAWNRPLRRCIVDNSEIQIVIRLTVKRHLISPNAPV